MSAVLMEPLMTLYQQPGSSKLCIMHNDGIKAYPHKYSTNFENSTVVKIRRETEKVKIYN